MAYLLLKLTSGEELIAEVEETKETYVAVRPAALVFDQNTFGMIPFMPFSKDHTVTFDKAQIPGKAFPDDKLIQEYKRVYEPNAIITPPQGIIVNK